MRLLDLIVSKAFLGQPLEGAAWYLRLELPDGLEAWKRKGKFTIEEANQMLATVEADFLVLVRKFKEAVEESAEVEEKPTLWLNDSNDLKMTTRCLMNIEEGDTIETAISRLKERLKQQGIYLRVKML